MDQHGLTKRVMNFLEDEPPRQESPISASSPLTVGDLIGGDHIKAGDISGNNVAIGRGAQVIVNYIEKEIDALRDKQAFEQAQLGTAITKYVEELQKSAQWYQPSGTGNPYKPLLAYRISEAGLFFGREKAIGSLLDKLVNPFTVLHARSGSGKTSLLNAGVMPRLFANGHVPIYVRAKGVPLQEAIKNEILKHQTARNTPTLDKMPLDEFMLAVTQLLGDKRVFVLIDQFEEQFHQTPNPALIEFIQQLSRCLNDELLRVHWLLSIREEWLSNISTYGNMIDRPLANEYLLLPLSREEAKEIITKPVEKLGLAYEPSLVSQLLDHLEDKEILSSLVHHPVDQNRITPTQLQIVCSRLFDRIEPHVSSISLELYYSLKGVSGILQGHLDDELNKLSRSQRPLAWEILKTMVTSDGHRRSRTQEELTEEPEIKGVISRIQHESAQQSPLENTTNEHTTSTIVFRSLQQLMAIHLIIPEESEEEDATITYELVHDYLAERIMERLKNEPETQARKLAQELLEVGMRSYQQTGALLSKEYFDIINSQQNRLVLNDVARDLLAFSAEEHKSKELKLAEERAAQAEKLAMQESARRIAEEEAHEEAEKRVKQVAIAGLVAMVLAIVAISYWQYALNNNSETVRTDAQLYANLAREQLTIDPVVANHLARNVLPRSEEPRPYVAAAEFALTHAIRDTQERWVRDFFDGQLTRAQVAAGNGFVAIGGNQPAVISVTNLVTYPLAGEYQEVEGVLWSPDDTLAIYDGVTMTLWLDFAQPLHTTHSFDHHITCAAWNPEREEIAICVNKSLYLWSDFFEEPALIAGETYFDRPVAAVHWSANGEKLAAWDTARDLVVWDNPTKQITLNRKGLYSRTLWDGDWSPDGQYLVTTAETQMTLANGNRVVSGIGHIWPMQEPFQPITITFGAGRSAVRFIDHSLFVTWTSEPNPTAQGEVAAQLWTLDGTLVQILAHGGRVVQDVHIDDNDQSLLFFLSNGDVAGWRPVDSATQPYEWAFELTKGHTKPVITVAPHPTGRYLATAAKDSLIHIWDLQYSRSVMALYGHTGTDLADQGRADIFHISWPDRTHLLSVGEDGALRQWRIFDDVGHPICQGMDDDQLPRCFDEDSPTLSVAQPVVAAQWLMSDTLFVALADRSAFTWKVTSTATVPISTDRFGSSSPLWLGNGMALITRTGTIALVNVIENAELYALPLPAEPVKTAALYGRDLLATEGISGTIQLWQLAVEQEQPRALAIPHAPAHRAVIQELQWSDDGTKLLGAGEQLVVWDVETGEVLWSTKYMGMATTIHAVFSPDGQLVAFSHDNVLGVIEMQRAQQFGSTPVPLEDEGGPVMWLQAAHTDPILGVVWVQSSPWQNQYRWWHILYWRQPNERLLLFTWSGDGTARLWDWEQRKEIARVYSDLVDFVRPIDLAAIGVNTPILTVAKLPNPDPNEGGSEVTQMRIWESWHYRPETLLAKAETLITRNLSTEQRSRFARE